MKGYDETITGMFRAVNKFRTDPAKLQAFIGEEISMRSTATGVCWDDMALIRQPGHVCKKDGLMRRGSTGMTDLDTYVQ